MYCNDVSGLVKALGMEYKAVECRLFMDFSVINMKAVLLHIGKKVASVSITHSVVHKDSFSDINIYLMPCATIFSSGRFVVI